MTPTRRTNFKVSDAEAESLYRPISIKDARFGLSSFNHVGEKMA